MKFNRLGRVAIALATMAVFGHSQTPGGSVSNTETDTYLPSYPDLISSIQWSQWAWLDGANTWHYFPGTTTGREHYILHIDMDPTPTGMSYSSMVSPASDNSCILYATGPNYSINTPTQAAHPKYYVLGVIYSPPGAGSTVTFNKATTFGTTNTVQNSFNNNFSTQFTAGVNVNLAAANAGYQAVLTSGWSYTSINGTSVSLSTTISQNQTLTGTGTGINHDNDIILLWLNPEWDFTGVGIDRSPMTAFNGALGVNTAYATWENTYGGQSLPSNTMDVVAISVGELRTGQILPYNVTAMQRQWDSDSQPSGWSPALTQNDYAAILNADPFWNCQTTLNSSNQIVGIPTVAQMNNLQPGRFTEVTIADYIPNWTSGRSDSNSYTNTTSQSVANAYSLGYSWEVGGGVFFAKAGLKVSDTLTWTQTYGSSTTDSGSATASFSVQGPTVPSGQTYSGPTQIAVYRDNVYGSYMFAYLP
jgi:hypothetical protein